MDVLKMCFGEKINENMDTERKKENIFKLPIEYLPSDNLFPISDIVMNDLELVSIESPYKKETEVNKKTEEKTEEKSEEKSEEKEKEEEKREPMCNFLMNPQHEYATNMIPKMGKYITNNIAYLSDTQTMIKRMKTYDITMNSMPYKMDCSEMKEIWKTVKEDPTFLERYSYMEFEMFKNLNHSPSFLQVISVINMSSPILSFIMPIMCLIIPFILLKIQGIPISLTTYVSTLQDIAKHHLLGKIINGFSNFSANTLMYLLITIGLYVYQLYQNYLACIRFYRNIRNINQILIEMKKYLSYTILSMKTYSNITKNLVQYHLFNIELCERKNTLEELLEVLEKVQPFEPSIYKIGEIGTLLQCFYELYSNTDFEDALKYSFEYEGYINNISGIAANYEGDFIHMADFVEPSTDEPIDEPIDEPTDKSSRTSFIGQFYPPHIKFSNSTITNDCDLSNNMIITGPNASGKTTFLKTTALNIIFSQQFGCGFYKSAVLHPYTHIHSYLNIPDTSGRDSLFQAESRRCKDILDIIENSSNNKNNGNNGKQSRHFAMFDELYSGTNPVEATKSAYSFLKYLSKFENVDYVLTTHYVSVCEKLESSNDNVKTWKMDALETEDGDIEYTYKIKEGVSKIEGAVKVLRDMKYPTEILEEIENFEQ